MKIEIKNFQGNYLVVWDENKTIKDIDPTLRIFDTVFGEFKCYVLGLVESNIGYKNPYWVTWVNDTVWAQDRNNNYSNWVERTFKIVGIGFNKISDAEKFKDRLEKAIVWQELKK